MSTLGIIDTHVTNALKATTADEKLDEIERAVGELGRFFSNMEDRLRTEVHDVSGNQSHRIVESTTRPCAMPGSVLTIRNVPASAENPRVWFLNKRAYSRSPTLAGRDWTLSRL